MTSLWGGIAGLMRGFGAGTPVPTGSLSAGTLHDNPQALYALMRSLAGNTGTYQELATYLDDYGLHGAALQGLRNPTNAVASVYRATLMPGTIRENDDESALPLVLRKGIANQDNLKAKIHDVWKRSNWDRRKNTAAYDVANLGDQIFKVVGERDAQRLYFEIIQPDYVTEVETDGRGYLTYIRIDVPKARRNANGEKEPYWQTEVWDKASSQYRLWEHTQSPTTATGELGTPRDDLELEQVYGTNFVPFVHWKFEESSSSDRGTPAVMHALDKIIYGDALVTALHQRLTNHNVPDKVLSSTYIDSESGFGLPVPQISDSGEITINGVKVWSLPGGWNLTDTVPQLDYANHLAVVNAHYKALMQTDLPELAWYEVSEAGGDLSGKALNYKLTPAKARVEEARGNAEDALIRITQMCLTVGQNLDIPGFGANEIGTFDNGDFDFWIADRPIIPTSPEEQSELETRAAARVQARVAAGMALPMALMAEGMSEDEAMRLSQADVVDGLQQ